MITTPDSPDRDTITADTVSPEDELVAWLTCYSFRRPRRARSMEAQLRQAYGDRMPGSHRRWLDQQPEREAWERWQRQRAGWALYRRVHGEPGPAELARREYEAETRRRARAECGGSSSDEAVTG